LVPIAEMPNVTKMFKATALAKTVVEVVHM
jgi:hypothetical protein